MPRYCLNTFPLISRTWPGASGHPARRPPQMTPSARVSALTMSPDFVIPPSASSVTPRFFAACDATYRAVSCGIPTPATMRVVQMEPGPWPTFTIEAPQSARYSTPAAEVTLPATMGRSLKCWRMRRTASPTPVEWPWAVETATTSAPRSTRAVTCPRRRS